LPARWAQRDPDNYRDPNTFDGYRFVDPATGTCDISGTITPTEKWLPFAIGASTCPGRLAGTRITQIMFAKILHGYDANLEGVDGQFFLHYDGVTWPNPEIAVLVRTRQAGANDGP
jgi:cytochrome P450